MTYLLDTNAMIALLNPALRDRILARITRCDPGQVVTSAIVAHELYFGACKSTRRQDILDRLAILFRDIEPLPLTTDDCLEAGSIRAALAADGTPIGPYDVLIAGQARCRDLVVVTSNTGEFRRVADLTIADWLNE